MVKVSIVVPVYNAELYLKKCINSLVNQSLRDIEIIIINDGSTDDSEKIIKTFHDDRIVYISKDNEGIGKTRNMGINLAKGKYIAFIDSDDSVSLDFCSHMYEKANKENCDVIICDYYNVTGKEFRPMHLKSFKTSFLLDNPSIMNSINLGPCNKLFSLKLLNDNNIRFNEKVKYEDVPFVCESLVKAKLISKLNEPLNYFTVHKGSQTTVRDKKIFDIIENVKEILKIFSAKELKESVNNLVVPLVLDYAVQTRYIKNDKVRNEFIDLAYGFLDSEIPNWNMYINQNVLKKTILKNKNLLKLYCKLYIKR